MALATMVTRLDGLAAIRDRDRAASEAGRQLRPNTYLEPFALRTLGVVREDEELVRLAQDRFRSSASSGTRRRRGRCSRA